MSTVGAPSRIGERSGRSCFAVWRSQRALAHTCRSFSMAQQMHYHLAGTGHDISDLKSAASCVFVRLDTARCLVPASGGSDRR